MGIISLCVIAMLLYIRIKLLKPFNKLKEVPYELSKGNLTVGLKENKNRYFGRFVWGLDLLRENIEEQRIKELALQKEKKTLVLSISHDIKTPLSAIKLYSKALSRNLYDSDEKRKEIAESISAKADEIENFVGQIIKASSEDFLNLEVKNSEYYLSDLINKISEYYTEKLSLLKIEFKIGEYNNCLLKGDIDRAVEVLQNVIENAIKYCDGGFINIVISEEEDCRIITVENSGCTLSENELPHIFDSFWRGSNAEKNSGSGLGLYICRQLMTKMDGDIFAECEDGKMKVSSVFRMI
jgi:signal transduction histidine kinase